MVTGEVLVLSSHTCRIEWPVWWSVKLTVSFKSMTCPTTSREPTVLMGFWKLIESLTISPEQSHVMDFENLQQSLTVQSDLVVDLGKLWQDSNYPIWSESHYRNRHICCNVWLSSLMVGRWSLKEKFAKFDSLKVWRSFDGCPVWLTTSLMIFEENWQRMADKIVCHSLAVWLSGLILRRCQSNLTDGGFDELWNNTWQSLNGPNC